MKRLLFMFLMFAPSSGFSQLYINKTKSKVKEEIGKTFSEKKTISSTIAETDSSLVLKTTGPGSAETDHIYSFDKTGKCSTEKTVTGCDSCFDKLLQQVLALKKYRWKKMNLNQYISKFSAGVFVEIQAADNMYSLTVFRMHLKKKMYRSLFK